MKTNLKLENQILNADEVLQKITRIAYEIYEQNIEEKELVIAGIIENGYKCAKILEIELNKISPFQTSVIEISLDKYSILQSEIKLNPSTINLQNKVVILVDDVLNTGRTLAYSLKPFLNCEIKKLQTAIIVDRNHKKFPISADYVGYALSTTLKEHIKVGFKENKIEGVYLN